MTDQIQSSQPIKQDWRKFGNISEGVLFSRINEDGGNYDLIYHAEFGKFATDKVSKESIVKSLEIEETKSFSLTK